MTQTSSNDRDENAIDVVHHFGGGVYAKEATIRAGSILVQHRHTYDHLSILASGRALLEVDGDRRELVGPTCVEIKAGKHHAIRALTDAVWFCIHATDETDPKSADRSLIETPDTNQMLDMARSIAR